MKTKVLRCFAYGRDGDWQAFCVDLDLAVQGASLSEVRSALNGVIAEYIDVVNESPAADQERMLNRSAPWTVWLQYYFTRFMSWLGGRDDNKHHKSFTVQHAI